MALHHLIGGVRVAGQSTRPSVNPSDTDEMIAEVSVGNRATLNEAIDAACTAAPGWACASPEFRGDVLDRAGTLLIERAEALGTLLSREEGKTLNEGRAEVQRAGRIFRYFAGEALRCHGRTLESVRPGVEVSTLREPVGVVGLITPWNFPIAIPAWKAAPALAFGNAVILKPAAITPAIASALADILAEAGLPPGVLNLIFIPGALAGELASDSRIAAVSFTGSTGVGRTLAGKAAAAGVRIQLEMGGKNPLVVLDDADLERAVSIAIDGAYFGSGQRCTASSRLIVTEGIHDRFVAAMTERLAAMRVGHALDPLTHIGPVSSDEQATSILSHVDMARAAGARIEIGGHRLTRDRPGYYLSPALVTDTTAEMAINRDEVFGPVASVLRVRHYEDAVAAANDSEFGLAAGIVTSSLAHAHDFRRRARAGMVMVNVPTAGVDYHVPFGGTRASSYGPREQGFAALEFYSQTKTSYLAW